MSAVQDGTNYAFWSDEQRRCYDMWGTKNPPPEEIKYDEPDHDDDDARPDEQSIEDEE